MTFKEALSVAVITHGTDKDLNRNPDVFSPESFETGGNWAKKLFIKVCFTPSFYAFGCFTGDCPHSKQVECENAVSDWIDQHVNDVYYISNVQDRSTAND